MKLKDVPVLIAAVLGIILFLDFFVTPPVGKVIGIDIPKWASIVVGIAMVLGIINLTESNARRLMSKTTDSQQRILSLVLLISLYGTIITGGLWTALYSWIFQYIYNIIYSAMFALLGFYILVAAYRTLKPRNLEVAVFLIVVVILTLRNMPIVPIIWPSFKIIGDWIWDVTVTGGSRGWMMTIFIGATVFALRVFLGYNRRILGGE